jgi:hypothetical protein
MSLAGGNGLNEQRRKVKPSNFQASHGGEIDDFRQRLVHWPRSHRAQ